VHVALQVCLCVPGMVTFVVPTSHMCIVALQVCLCVRCVWESGRARAGALIPLSSSINAPTLVSVF
jgi:hypothetical protein